MNRCCRIPTRSWILLLAGALLAGAPCQTLGQLPGQVGPGEPGEPAATPFEGRVVSLSVGVPGSPGNPFFELATLGVQWTDVEPGRAGLDLAVGTIPRLLPEGLFGLGARGGIVRPIELGTRSVLLPSAGLSFIGLAGPGGGGGAFGLHAGLAAVHFPEGAAFGVRPGISAHRFAGATEAVWLAEIGLVWRRGAR